MFGLPNNDWSDNFPCGIDKKDSCNHIYGFDEGYAISSNDEETELPELVMIDTDCDIIFSYCPKCGEKLR